MQLVPKINHSFTEGDTYYKRYALQKAPAWRETWRGMGTHWVKPPDHEAETTYRPDGTGQHEQG